MCGVRIPQPAVEDIEPEMIRSVTDYDRYRERKLMRDMEAMGAMQADADAAEAAWDRERRKPKPGQLSMIGEDGKTLYLFSKWSSTGGKVFLWAFDAIDAYELCERHGYWDGHGAHAEREEPPYEVEKFSRK